MKKIILITVILVILTSSLISAQAIQSNKNTVTDLFAFPTTLSLRHLKTSQSFTFSSTYNSGTKSAYYLSNFCNRFELPLSSKLNVALDLNFVNFGEFGSNSPLISKDNTKVLPNFMMKYTPTENLKIYLEINTFNPYYTPFAIR